MQIFWQKYQILFFYIFSGLFLGIGFVVSELWFLGLVGVGFLVYLVFGKDDTESEKSKRRLHYWGGSLAFVTKAALATSVLWSVYPIAWLSDKWWWAELLMIGLYWVLAATALGAFGFLVVYLSLQIKQRFGIAVAASLLPVWWVVAEILGSLVFSLVFYGAGGTVNVAYSLGYVGYLLAEHHSLLLLAKVYGVYGLSVFFIYLGIGLLWLWQTAKIKITITYSFSLLIFIIVLLVVTAKIDFTNPLSPSGQTVMIIDTKFGGTDYYSLTDYTALKAAEVEKAVDAALLLQPDYLLLPEGAGFIANEDDLEFARRRLGFFYNESETVIIDSGTKLLPNGDKLVRGVIYDGKNKELSEVFKSYLVPQGEYLPYVFLAILKITASEEFLAETKKELNFIAGKENDFLKDSHLPVILFCFGSVDPAAVWRKLQASATPPFVAHPISHAWFNNSKILEHQLDQMLKIQAVWNGVPIVSAGNMVDGALYTKTGQKVLPQVLQTEKWWQIKQFTW